jgi:hypothetical protein
VNAAAQRANSLLGSFGGTSSVYGVDANATQAPNPSSNQRIVPATPAPVVPAPQSPQGKSPSGEIRLPEGIRRRIGDLSKNLIQVQIRISAMSKAAANAQTSALLGSNRGPQSDFNLVVAPQLATHLFAGVNDLSANQTFNLALVKNAAPGIQVGGGILYSRLGVMGSITHNIFGFEGRAYDLRHGYVDGYFHIHPTQNIDLFAGERDIVNPQRRTVYGLQYQF